MIWGIISIVLWVSTIIFYIVRNLLTKNKRLEDLIIERDVLISNITSLVQESDRKLKDIDKLGAFRSDDEVGFFFNTLKEIQSSLNLYFKNQNE